MSVEDSIERHYAMVTLQYYERQLPEGSLLVEVNLPELNKYTQESVNVTNLISCNDLEEIKAGKKEHYTNLLIERLVLHMDEEQNISIIFDEQIEPMSTEQREHHRKKFDEEVV